MSVNLKSDTGKASRMPCTRLLCLHLLLCSYFHEKLTGSRRVHLPHACMYFFLFQAHELLV